MQNFDSSVFAPRDVDPRNAKNDVLQRDADFLVFAAGVGQYDGVFRADGFVTIQKGKEGELACMLPGVDSRIRW
jgi:hypothetical protein